jgi:hypothetical protein
MSTSLLDLRLREEMAGAVLKEVAALEPAERLREAQALTQILGKAVQALEELWADLRGHLEGGVSPSDAATIGRILIRSANLISSSLDLLVQESPSLEAFRQANASRLQRIKALAAGVRRLVEMPAPAPDPEQLRRSLEQINTPEAVNADDWLAELKG